MRLLARLRREPTDRELIGEVIYRRLEACGELREQKRYRVTAPQRPEDREKAQQWSRLKPRQQR